MRVDAAGVQEVVERGLWFEWPSEPVAVSWRTTDGRANGTVGSTPIRRVYNSSQRQAMGAIPVELDQDLVALLEELQRPAKEAARELIVLELYRQGEVSSGRAAQLLGMDREEFIRYASKQGIPYFQLEGEELQRELDALKKL